MKKNYILAILFVFAMVSVNAQFTSNAEGLAAGSHHSAPWGSWSGAPGAEDIIVTSAQAHSGVQSFTVENGADGGGPQDAILDLGAKIFGEWSIDMWMYVPAGKVGYFNIQGNNDQPIVPQWIVGNIEFGNVDDVNAGVVDMSTNDPELQYPFSFPHDQWFRIVANISANTGMTLATWEFNVDGCEVVPAGTSFADAAGETANNIGSLDFFATGPECNFFVDDLIYANSLVDTSGFVCTISVADLQAKGFNFYPNPVKNELNLDANENITSVSIYNVIGQEVKNVKPNALTSKIDMSDLESGAYFVKVAIGNTVGTIKVLK